jgi:hypothetical protein
VLFVAHKAQGFDIPLLLHQLCCREGVYKRWRVLLVASRRSVESCFSSHSTWKDPWQKHWVW